MQGFPNNQILCYRYDSGSVFGLHNADTYNGLDIVGGWLLNFRLIHPNHIELDQNILVVLRKIHMGHLCGSNRNDTLPAICPIYVGQNLEQTEENLNGWQPSRALRGKLLALEVIQQLLNHNRRLFYFPCSNHFLRGKSYMVECDSGNPFKWYRGKYHLKVLCSKDVVFFLLFQALLGVPQFWLNCSRGHTTGLASSMIGMWLFGDLFKLYYYNSTESPLQLILCSFFQCSTDCAILTQFWIYREKNAQMTAKIAAL